MFVFAFHTPSYFKTPVTAVSIAVWICAPVANLVDEELTVPVFGVNCTDVVPLVVSVFVLPELIKFTCPVAPVVTAVTLPYASTVILSILLLFYVEP